ncbi:MAG: MFS transporter [Acetobacteraceae bacterium]
MTASGPQGRPVAGRSEQKSTRIVFFIVGFSMAAWAPLVPFAQARSGLGDGGLGLLLLSLGIGSIVTMSLAGALAARFGCRLVVLASAAPLCVSLPLLTVLSDPAPLAVALFVFGAAVGSLDVTMNLQAIVVERDSGRAMMSGFHGLFSVGGIAGAVFVTAGLGVGATPFVTTLGVVACIAVAFVMAGPHMLAYGSQQDAPVLAMPRGPVLFIGALCFVAFLAEGAILDWSAVFLSATRNMATAYAGLGYAAFAVTMTAGRLTGDRIVERFGGITVVVAGALCSAAGFALAILTSSWPLALAGFALIGAGCSNIVPVLYTRVGRQSAMAEHAAVSAVTTLGYAGILIGPAVIGLVAHVASLPMAFLLLMVLQLGVAVGGSRLKA